MKSLDLLVANLVLSTSSAAASDIPQPLPEGVCPKPAALRIPNEILGSTDPNLVLSISYEKLVPACFPHSCEAGGSEHLVFRVVSGNIFDLMIRKFCDSMLTAFL